MKLKSLLTENTKLKFPIYVEGSYRGRGCDEFHAFNDTHGRIIGGMNVQVNKKLKEIYDAGYNPDITNIQISMDNSNYTVSWKVTIKESFDGKAWIGLVSRGAGSNSKNDVINRADPNNASSHTSPTAIRSRYTNIVDLKQVLDYKYLPSTGCKVRQIFYKYTVKGSEIAEGSLNRKTREIIGTLYYMLIKNPEKYFGQFSSWSPIYVKSTKDGNYRIGSGDNEKDAANWLQNYFNKNMLPVLKSIKSSSNNYDKANADQIIKLVSKIIDYIRQGKQGTITLGYYTYNPTTKKYDSRNKVFDWSYL